MFTIGDSESETGQRLSRQGTDIIEEIALDNFYDQESLDAISLTKSDCHNLISHFFFKLIKNKKLDTEFYGHEDEHTGKLRNTHFRQLIIFLESKHLFNIKSIFLEHSILRCLRISQITELLKTIHKKITIKDIKVNNIPLIFSMVASRFPGEPLGELVKFLYEKDVCLYAQPDDEFNNTALHYLIANELTSNFFKHQPFSMASELISAFKNSSINDTTLRGIVLTKDQRGRTAVTLAAAMGADSLVKDLIALIDPHHRSTLCEEVLNATDQLMMKAADYAALYGNLNLWRGLTKLHFDPAHDNRKFLNVDYGSMLQSLSIDPQRPCTALQNQLFIPSRRATIPQANTPEELQKYPQFYSKKTSDCFFFQSQLKRHLSEPGAMTLKQSITERRITSDREIIDSLIDRLSSRNLSDELDDILEGTLNAVFELEGAIKTVFAKGK